MFGASPDHVRGGTITAMDEPESNLIDRLLAHRTLKGVPREQLEWLAATGQLQTVSAGEVLTRYGEAPAGMYVILDGHLSIRIDRGGGVGERMVMEWHGGDVTGLLPYSRIKTPPGSVVAERQTELFVLDKADLPRMIDECRELTAVLVHVMIDRARAFKSSELLDEKMASLGRLAAGLAHELNNPASAVVRSASALINELRYLDEARRQLSKLNMSDTQVFSIGALRGERLDPETPRTPLDVADREEALSDWMDDHGVDGVDLKPLVSMAYAPSDLDAIRETVGREKVGPVLAHISSEAVVRQLAGEISTAAARIHALVAAVKGFTHVDQSAALQPLKIGRGLADTITVLGFKAKGNSVTVSLDVPDDLPEVECYGGELNQVWSNLIDNAIDATPGGKVQVTARVEGGKVIVRVVDDGPGIPEKFLGQIFDPFFTTKPVGQGTGLGLEISRRIIERHHGTIDVTTGPDGTEFKVSLPPVVPSPTN